MSEDPINFELLKEAYDIECKAAQGRDGFGELPKDFWESYSAMANSDGGSVFLGVQEKKEQFKVLGVQKPEKLIKDLFDAANSREKVSVNLLGSHDVIQHTFPEGVVLEINIRRATRKERPVFLKRSPLGNSFRRRHESDHRMSEEEVKRMLADQQYDSLDHRILKGFDLEDLHKPSFATYRQSVAVRSPDSHFDELSDIDFLRQIGGWRKNRESGQEGLTIAGLLMFGTYQAIRDEFPHYFLDYQERDDSEESPRYLDRICPDGTWSGNLYEFYRKVYPKLVSDLKVAFQLKEGVREGDSPAHVAIREAFVNALVHGDYSVASAVLVVKRPDLIGFKNPGLMRVPLEVALQGGESDSRNKSIQDMFRLVGAGERQGHGIRKIIEGWKQFDWRIPLIEEQEEPSPRVLVTLSMLSLFPEPVVEELSQLFPATWPHLSEQEKLACILAQTEGAVTHHRLSQFSTKHPRDVSELLQHLEKEGILASTGQYRAKTYHISGHVVPNVQDVFPAAKRSSTDKDVSSTNSGGSSTDNGRSSTNNGVSSANSGASSTNSETISTNLDEMGRIIHPGFKHPFVDDLSKLQKEFRSDLEEIAALPRAKRRMDPELLKNVILTLCEDQYVTVGALSQLVDREVGTLRGQYLSKLKDEGKLRLAFPRTPTDPKQAYLTT